MEKTFIEETILFNIKNKFIEETILLKKTYRRNVLFNIEKKTFIGETFLFIIKKKHLQKNLFIYYKKEI